MKISQVLAVVGFALFAGLVSAEETKPEVAVTELPTNEKAFVEVVGKLNKAKIVELLGVVAMFAFLNRWNDTMATPLEAVPTALARDVLGAQGWDPGKHGG